MEIKNINELLKRRSRRLKHLEKEIESTPKYQSYIKKEKKIFEKLKSSLNDEVKEILIMYFEVLEQIETYQIRFYYDSGFKDCAEVIKIMHEPKVE